ncbi:MAG: prepilin-type N-terminal cleavage/methylation domain-containing protein [Armatimonadota bacterium]|nr:prepilin-type N-terminal cleavage/methylation domain-containing protein [Armatimonadota bacterium]
MLTFFARRLRDHDRGFTLIELLIVIAIIAILAAVLIPNFLRSRAQAKVSATKSNMKNIATALESYAVDNNGNYPIESGDASQVLSLLKDNNYMKEVPKEPDGGEYTYTYQAGPPPSYSLCDDTTLKAIKTSATALIYDPARGFSEADTCP